MYKFWFVIIVIIFFSCGENKQQLQQSAPTVKPDTQKTKLVPQLDSVWCLNCLTKMAEESTSKDAYTFIMKQEEMGDTLRRCLDLSYSLDSFTTIRNISLLLMKTNLAEIKSVGRACAEIRMCGSFWQKRGLVDVTCPIPYYFFRYFNVSSDDVEIALSSSAYMLMKNDKKFLKDKLIRKMIKEIDKATLEKKYD